MGGAKGNRKRQEEEEFQALLSNLRDATKHAGEEKIKANKKKEKRRGSDNSVQTAPPAPQEPKRSPAEQELIMRQNQLQLQQLIQQLLLSQRAFLDSPDTTFHGDKKENTHFNAAVGEMQGWRAAMEDEHVMDIAFQGESSSEALLCVFDGHSGKSCAQLCGTLFPLLAVKHEVDGKIAFHDMFMGVDAKLRETLNGSGCTAVVVHVTPSTITCGSVGDSRAVLCRDGVAFPLAYDHKPEQDAERKRIEAAGDFVQDNRVNGQLAMSRAMGDFMYKGKENLDRTQQPVIAVPDVIEVERTEKDTFVAVACDGIFDVLSNEELIAMIVSHKKDGKTNIQICEELCNFCLAPVDASGQRSRNQGTDNMTIMIVDLL